ncbi:uncharacterized protein [Diabrotica undecimpunctata]|uniref:uncharacterized protein n=1 Tax=Diabrotica undecimpunctata TaxID=50387 RepID=UPI003B63CD2B
MGAFDLVTGTIGIIIFAGRKHDVLCIGYKQKLCENYLIFSIFHLVGSIFITSGIIWEKSSLILLFGILHLSMVVAFIAHSLMFVPTRTAFGAIFISICFIIYCLYNVYRYYIELKLKKKNLNQRIRSDEVIYFCNSNVDNL